MESLVYTPTYELFLILEPLRRSFRRLCEAVDILDSTDAPEIIGADIYYRATTDVALLALRFDERALTYQKLTWVLDCASGAGIPILDPSKLSETDRRQFYRSYLPSYQTRIEDLSGAIAALYELGRRLRLVTGRAMSHGEGPKHLPSRGQGRFATKEMFGAPPSQPLRAPGTTPVAISPDHLSSGVHTTTANPRPATVPADMSARGKLGPNHRSPEQRDQRANTLPLPGTKAEISGAKRSVESAQINPAISGDDERTTRDIERFRDDDEPAPVARGKGKRQRQDDTAAETPVARRPSSEPARDTGGVVQHEHGADGSGPIAQPDIEVRYRRGGQWTMARLRSLSSKGAYLVTGALPRLGDLVTLAFAYDDIGVTVQAKVYHITTVQDASETGSAGFAVRFPHHGSPERDKLIEILRRALAAGVKIKPPPSRLAVRFPVFWPVRINALGSGLRVDALDVSVGGMFLTTGRDLGEELALRFPLDNGDSAIHGRVRVVRRVDAETARRRAMLPGYGVSIVELDGSARRRYANFVSRVQQRSQTRVFVGAGEERVRELMAGLASVGYEVTGASDPAVLTNPAELGGATVDVAVIDTSLGGEKAQRFRHIFAHRDVRCLVTHTEPPEQARLAVDRLIELL